MILSMNIVKLAGYDTVANATIGYITFTLANNIPSMFYNALPDDALKKVFAHKIKRPNRGRDI